MKKVVGVLIILSLVWLGKVSYDVFQIHGEWVQLQDKLVKLEQNNAALNDEVVALQRQVPSTVTSVPSSTTSSQQNPSAAQLVALQGVEPVRVIQQHSELIQFALQQQQYIYAIEQLNRLDRELETYDLSPALKQSLHQVLAKDRMTIQQYVVARNAQQNTLDALLGQIDRLLTQTLQNSVLNPGQLEPQHFWQKWLQVERVKQPNVELANRSLILKEAQLRLLLARQALLKGQYLEYQEILNTVIQQLEMLPDQGSQQLKQRLLKAKSLPVLPAPKLAVQAVLGGA
ncbi:hypothetical protein [Acinetobacter sp. GSS19]|uniref:hypothetical protein n=1 Tax=Acinetobacter sp. GSS19 TaxID=3020716 RepID=UPI002360FE93|nr:hypothetical protein [Acinetobacter sp. GSS19]